MYAVYIQFVNHLLQIYFLCRCTENVEQNYYKASLSKIFNPFFDYLKQIIYIFQPEIFNATEKLHFLNYE